MAASGEDSMVTVREVEIATDRTELVFDLRISSTRGRMIITLLLNAY